MNAGAVQAALEFIRHCRSAVARGGGATSLPGARDLAALRTEGREAGFEFTIDDLREAFRIDYRMRLLARASAGAVEPPASPLE